MTEAPTARRVHAARLSLPSRLALAMAEHRVLIGWLAPLAVAIVGGLLRFWRLGHPETLVFDETYYVKDGYSLLVSGYERQWPEGSDDGFNQGDASMLRTDPGFVVHPPAGKWLIALGMQLFGYDSAFGWRFAAALVGALSILMIGRIARRLLSSTLLGTVAAGLFAFDGAHFVHSRTSLLDIFLMFWILAGLGAILIDRDRARARVLANPAGPDAPVGFRPWLLVAGVCFGLAMATKWSGAYPLALFGIAAVLWTLGARRAAGSKRALRTTARRDIVPSFLTLVPVAVVSYIVSWAGWLAGAGAYNRNWAKENSGWWDFLPDWLVSLSYHHYQAYRFHVGVDSEHPYMSNPWGWTVQWRPTSFYFRKVEDGSVDCGADVCAAAVTSLGNPVIWWGATIAILVCVVAWIAHRDWRAGAILGGLAATWLPWFDYQERTIFTFYTIVMLPFLVLGLTYALGLLWGRADDRPPGKPLPAALIARRLVVGAYLGLAVLMFWYFWPVYTATWIPMDDWRARMWLPSWI